MELGICIARARGARQGERVMRFSRRQRERATWRYRRLPAALALSAALCGMAGLARAADDAAPANASELALRLDGILASRALRDAEVSALVVGAERGEILYEHAPDRALTPASNMKILTAIAALTAFGPTYRFETPIAADRLPDGDGNVGTVYVRGSGDPALNSEDWWRVAIALRSAGLRGVTGDIVLDDSGFDTARWHAAWGPASSRAYHAPVGALMANYGSFVVRVRPGAAPGAPVSVDLEPPVPYLQLVNRGVTGRAGERGTLVIGREGGEAGLVVHVDGALPVGSPQRAYYRSVVDPARYAGAILRMHLEALGVTVGGHTVMGKVPDGAIELTRFEGRAMSEIVSLFMKWSNNTVAEALVKSIGARGGRQGSWENGVPALRSQLQGLGLTISGASIVDGSGLAYQNRLAPRLLVSALRLARSSFAIGPEFVAALPLAGRDGTLAKRAEAAIDGVRAKTGLLNRTTALSGYADLPDGRVAVFSILANGYRVSDDAAIAAMDRFAAALVSP